MAPRPGCSIVAMSDKWSPNGLLGIVGPWLSTASRFIARPHSARCGHADSWAFRLGPGGREEYAATIDASTSRRSLIRSTAQIDRRPSRPGLPTFGRRGQPGGLPAPSQRLARPLAAGGGRFRTYHKRSLIILSELSPRSSASQIATGGRRSPDVRPGG
jgi:hypothetical protein